MIEHIFNTVGLFFGIIGSVIIYIKGFPQPDFGPTTMSLVETEDEKTIKNKRERWHIRTSKAGVLLLMVGFFFQAVGTWV